MRPIVDHCRTLSAPVDLATLRAIADDAGLTADLADLRTADPTRPYGRRVLLDGPTVEVMLASWTPGRPSAIHDHGGSHGAVRVLAGRARHQLYRVRNGGLELAHDGVAQPGDVLPVGPDLIHAMGDDGGDVPLLTLHLYAGPIPYMTVWDPGPPAQTLRVVGTSGAWLPDPADVLAARDGTWPRAALDAPTGP